MSAPDLAVEIEVRDVTDWLSADLPAWATRTRFHARLVEREGVVVLTAKDTTGSVGYAIFDKQMSHLHYIETHKDCRIKGVESVSTSVGGQRHCRYAASAAILQR